MEIRHAAPADLPAIRALILESWRRTYPGVLPAEYLAGPVEADLARTWGPGRLHRALVLVAEREGGLAGMIAVLPDDPDGPYVDNLHVAASAEGQGVGRALLTGAARELSQAGHDRLHLTVVDTNARARAFYARMGGTEGAPIEDAMFEHSVTALPVRWSSLGPLIQASCQSLRATTKRDGSEGG